MVEKERIDSLPPIKRAREYHLYAQNGRRYIDLYQNGGSAIAGHRPGRVSTTLKNSISKGVYSEYPSVAEERFLKALKRVVPHCRHIYLFSSWERAKERLRFKEPPADPVTFSLLNKRESVDVSYWRPFIGAVEGANWAIPLLPSPGLGSQVALCQIGDVAPSGLSSDPLSPTLLEGMTQGVYEWISFRERASKALWERFDSVSLWSRRECYLLTHLDEKQYNHFWRAMLERGILYPPKQYIPAIIPAVVSDGELKLIVMEAKKWCQGQAL